MWNAHISPRLGQKRIRTAHPISDSVSWGHVALKLSANKRPCFIELRSVLINKRGVCFHFKELSMRDYRKNTFYNFVWQILKTFWHVRLPVCISSNYFCLHVGSARSSAPLNILNKFSREPTKDSVKTDLEGGSHRSLFFLLRIWRFLSNPTIILHEKSKILKVSDFLQTLFSCITGCCKFRLMFLSLLWKLEKWIVLRRYSRKISEQ
jgi:hypothetical protein